MRNIAKFHLPITVLNLWDDLSEADLSIVSFLEEKGFIKAQRRQFVYCNDPCDPSNSFNMSEPDCMQRLYIKSDYDENVDQLICDRCGCFAYPNSDQKRQYKETNISLNRAGLIYYIENCMTQGRLNFCKTVKGVYKILIPDNILHLVIIDLCADHRYFTVDNMRVNPTLLIHIRAFYEQRAIAVGAPHLSIVDFIENPNVLIKKINGIAKAGVPTSFQNQGITILSQASPLAKLEIKAAPLVIKVTETEIQINNLTVTSQQAKTRLLIFKILFNQYWQDFTSKQSAADHTFLSIHQLANLIAPYLEIADLEEQIRRPLNKMRTAIQAKLQKELGLFTEKNTVIETKPGSKKSGKADFGVPP